MILNYYDVLNNNYLGDVQGVFGILVFLVDGNLFSNDFGIIIVDGIYMFGIGIGYVQVFYVMVLLEDMVVLQNGMLVFGLCFIIVYIIFELCQLLEMDLLECVCVEENVCVVDLGEVCNGLEFYIIQYDGVVFDVDGNGNIDDVDGQYVYLELNGYDVMDYVEDFGELCIVYM